MKPLKALIIEDSETDALLLQEQLRAGGYELESVRVQTPADLRAALEAKSWDIVFSDHNMPHFNSTEALAIVRAVNTDVPFLIVSGSIGEEVAVAAMRAGAQDYLMKGNMARLVAAVDRELNEADSRRARRAAERALLAQEEEFRIAREIQRQLFPPGPLVLPGYDIAGASQPAAATGGDYYDFIPASDGRWLIVVGDVTGHGLGPALLMADARAYLRALALAGAGIVELFMQIRRLLLQDLGYEHFLTLFLAEFHPAAGGWTYINAGHPAGCVMGPDGGVRKEMGMTTPALGIDRRDATITPVEMTIEKGDLILLLTDGILEAASPEGDEFGSPRAVDVVRQTRERPSAEIIQSLFNAAQRFSGQTTLRDDMTAVVLKH